MKLLIGPTNDPLTEVTAEWLEEILNKLNSGELHCVSRKGKEVTRSDISKVIEENRISSIIFYGHGEEETGHWLGHEKEIILDLNNIDLLEGKFVYSIGCYTAKAFGEAAATNGIKCYIGFKGPVYCQTTHKDIEICFKEGANFLLHEMIERGFPSYKAYKTAKANYRKLAELMEKKYMETDKPKYLFAAIGLEGNMKSLRHYGQKEYKLSTSKVKAKKEGV